MIRFGREICSDLAAASKREWLETNGIGGFASSTVTGLNTRRYHGLLTAALNPPVGRHVLLSKLEETVVIDGRRFDLSVNQYPGTVHPEGYAYLEEFRLEPYPVFRYNVQGILIGKTLFLVHGENTVVVEYTANAPCTLEVRPLVAYRDYHSTTHANAYIRAGLDTEPGLASIQPYEGMPRLYVAHNAAKFEQSACWYYNFCYEVEKERGLDFQEDLFNPFTAIFELSRPAVVIASTTRRSADDAPQLRAAEISRRAEIQVPIDEPLAAQLAAAADQYIVRRGEGSTIIAGYHWFSDWGRDTMIALPGLALVTGRFDVARDILLAFTPHINQGMLPNRFPDAGEAPEYNTVDATLWFFEAVRSFIQYSNDTGFVREHLYSALKEIIDWHRRGTRYNIKVDADGLLSCGSPDSQLTWMDVKIGDWAVTPRYGKPVEIQALWYNALCVMRDLARIYSDTTAAAEYGQMACLAHANFQRQFWNKAAGYLYDVISPDGPDASIRPNQIFAVSLSHSMLDAEVARSVVAVVERELLTPVGLRTLSPADPRYRPRYEGPPLERDPAYHQGTVWPWLIGPYWTAFMKVHSGSPAAREKAAAWLRAFMPRLETAGLGQIAEIYDGDPPHTARGCIAQAWSVAEILRLACEYVFAKESKAMLAS